MGVIRLFCSSLLGYPFILSGRNQLRKARRGRKWPTAGAKITQSRVNKRELRRRASAWVQYDPMVKHSYTVEGKEYEGEQTHFVKYIKEKLHEIVSGYPIGKTVKVRYNPKDSSDILVLLLPISFQVYFFIGLGLFMWAIGLAAMITVMLTDTDV